MTLQVRLNPERGVHRCVALTRNNRPCRVMGQTQIRVGEVLVWVCPMHLMYGFKELVK
jgi:hypothetical protein